jgi:RNA polymerase sigma-70 factor (ECF subfamily)
MGQPMQQQQMQHPQRRDSGIFLKASRAIELADDQAMVEALVRNEAAAWREFQKRYDRLIMRCITKVTKSFSAVSADDVREIYGQLYLSLCANDRSKLRAFDPTRGSSLSSYVGMLAIHCAYDWLRAIRREPQREAIAAAEELSSELPDPYQATVQQERAQLAARVMEGFSERDRVFATLYFGEGMEPDEIARSMKISVKTVYSKKHKIQSKLESIVASLKGEYVAA